VSKPPRLFGVGTWAVVVGLLGLVFLKPKEEPPDEPTAPDAGSYPGEESEFPVERPSPTSDARVETQLPAAPRAPGSPPVPLDPSVAPISDATNLVALGMEIPTLRRQLEAEQKGARAAQLEFEIRNYLQEKAADGTYTVGRVDCRTTLCELQITAMSRDARTEWSKLLADLRQQPWADAIESTVHSAQEDEAMNTVGLVTIVRLRPAGR